jgi:hypothetical protein
MSSAFNEAALQGPFGKYFKNNCITIISASFEPVEMLNLEPTIAHAFGLLSASVGWSIAASRWNSCRYVLWYDIKMEAHRGRAAMFKMQSQVSKRPFSRS